MTRVSRIIRVSCPPLICPLLRFSRYPPFSFSYSKMPETIIPDPDNEYEKRSRYEEWDDDNNCWMPKGLKGVRRDLVRTHGIWHDHGVIEGWKDLTRPIQICKRGYKCGDLLGKTMYQKSCCQKYHTTEHLLVIQRCNLTDCMPGGQRWIDKVVDERIEYNRFLDYCYDRMAFMEAVQFFTARSRGFSHGIILCISEYLLKVRSLVPMPPPPPPPSNKLQKPVDIYEDIMTAFSDASSSAPSSSSLSMFMDRPLPLGLSRSRAKKLGVKPPCIRLSAEPYNANDHLQSLLNQSVLPGSLGDDDERQLKKAIELSKLEQFGVLPQNKMQELDQLRVASNASLCDQMPQTEFWCNQHGFVMDIGDLGCPKCMEARSEYSLSNIFKSTNDESSSKEFMISRASRPTPASSSSSSSSSSTQPASQQWTCPSCYFRNSSVDAKFCRFCDGRRPM
jgi:hypothetical protein